MNDHSVLPPDAAERDAARRESNDEANTAITEQEFEFVTKEVSEEERAAIAAVLAVARIEEIDNVKRAEQRDQQPWSRSQRHAEGISEYLSE